MLQHNRAHSATYMCHYDVIGRIAKVLFLDWFPTCVFAMNRIKQIFQGSGPAGHEDVPGRLFSTNTDLFSWSFQQS